MSLEDRPNPPLLPGPSRLGRLCDELMALPNVDGVYIGRKRRNGRLTKKVSLICCVTDKVDASKLSKAQRVPERISWSVGAAGGTVGTDVQVIGRTWMDQGGTVLGPGDSVIEPGTATVGVVLRTIENELLFTTAGHAFQQGVGTRAGHARRVVVRNATVNGQVNTFEGRLVKSSISGEADYAVIAPGSGVTADNLFDDQFVITSVFFPPHHSEIGRTLFVLTSRGLRRTLLHGVRARVDVGGIRRSEALITKWATIGGDSGCCLVDEDFRAWGLLVGTAILDGVRHSIFQSPHFILELEDASIN